MCKRKKYYLLTILINLFLIILSSIQVEGEELHKIKKYEQINELSIIQIKEEVNTTETGIEINPYFNPKATPKIDITYTTNSSITITGAAFLLTERELEKIYGAETIETLTNCLYGEARGIKGDHKKAAVVWCILNRYDNGNYGKTIIDVIKAPKQFTGYVENREYTEKKSQEHCKNIVLDVLSRYYIEKEYDIYVYRTLPKTYLYFKCVNKDNAFSEKWKSDEYWNWTLNNPYRN